ncbi:MAG: class I SAM-dependent methyltransferase [Vicinamibacterales bacterium]
MNGHVEGAPAARIAFDRLAASYDGVTGGEIFDLLRKRTHAVLARAFPSGCRVLEIGCGTGIDTVFLAGRGVRVLACDLAERMVSCTARRVGRHGLERSATVMACSLGDLAPYLDALDEAPSFDGIVSNFGALNCVANLEALGALTSRHVRPGGTVILGLMGRTCAWETLYFAATKRPHLAGRRRAASPVPVPVAGITVPTFYHRVSDVRAALGSGTRLTSILGIGVMIPPPYLEARWQRVPPIARRLCISADRLLAPWPPFNRLGDHVLLHFMKKRAAHD